MASKIFLLFIIFAPRLLMADATFCRQIFKKNSNNPPIMTEFRIEFNDSKAFKILRKINLVFSEYPRGYMENSHTQARITVPESRWHEIFGQDYETVIQELAKVQIYRVDIYEDGSQDRMLDKDLLISFNNEEIKFFPNEWITTQRSYSFQFDRRILTLMERYPEPAHVAIILEGGTIERDPEPYYY